MKYILGMYRDGFFDLEEATAALENIQIRGAFTDSGFIGYDYCNQKWIEFSF